MLGSLIDAAKPHFPLILLPGVFCGLMGIPVYMIYQDEFEVERLKEVSSPEEEGCFYDIRYADTENVDRVNRMIRRGYIIHLAPSKCRKVASSLCEEWILKKKVCEDDSEER